MVDWFDKFDSLSYISLVDAERSGCLDSVPAARRHKSFHLISPRENVSSGAPAIPILLTLLPVGSIVSPLILLFPPGQRIVNFVYTTFARLHDSGSCGYKHSSRSSLIDQEALGLIKRNTRR